MIQATRLRSVLLGLLPVGAMLAGCSLTGRPVPGRLADPPATILVLPPENGTWDPSLQDLFTATAMSLLRARGFAVVPAPLAKAWILEARLEGVNLLAPELAGFARDRGIDGLLSIRIERFDTEWFDGLRELDAVVVYRLLDTRDQNMLFERRSESQYWQPIGPGFGFGGPFEDHFHGGGSYGSRYRKPEDIVRAVQRGALASMPTGPFLDPRP